MEEQSAQALGWAAKGDYRDPHAGGLFLNMGDPAMLNRNRELTMNAGRQGISALGTPDPNYLATVNENTKAHQAEDDAARYENNIREGVAAASGAAGSAEGFDINRKSAALGTSSQLYAQQAARPKWWQFLTKGLADVGTGFATGGLSTIIKN